MTFCTFSCPAPPSSSSSFLPPNAFPHPTSTLSSPFTICLDLTAITTPLNSSSNLQESEMISSSVNTSWKIRIWSFNNQFYILRKLQYDLNISLNSIQMLYSLYHYTVYSFPINPINNFMIQQSNKILHDPKVEAQPGSSVKKAESFPTLHLSEQITQRQQLKKRINEAIKLIQVGDTDKKQTKIEVLKLRLRLIDSRNELSIERIDNLEDIFLHYCTHIFKTGKHMTFERLEYEKSHLTMDRFFVFLKDFSLTTMAIDGQQKQVVDKIQIIKIFKKVSGNCKDLNFEQFISCLERIAVLFFDAKTSYQKRKIKEEAMKKRRWQKYLKAMERKKLMKNGTIHPTVTEQKSNEVLKQNQHIQNKEDHEEEHQAQMNNNPNEQHQNENQNDQFIRSLMENKNTEDPNAQIQKILQENKEPYIQDLQNKSAEFHQSKFDQNLLLLTVQEKIQYFYQLIDVDNAAAFRKKMRELNLPIFQRSKATASKTKRTRSELGPMFKLAYNFKHEENNVEKSGMQLDSYEQKRLHNLRNKFEQRIERDKSNSPIINKQDYQRRKKSKNQDISDSSIPQTNARKQLKKRKLQITDIEADLATVSKMQFQNINFQKFNPNKLYAESQDDSIFMSEYSSRPPKLGVKIPYNLMEQRQTGASQIVLDRIKKRVKDVQLKEKQQQKSMVMEESALKRNKLIRRFMIKP